MASQRCKLSVKVKYWDGHGCLLRIAGILTPGRSSPRMRWHLTASAFAPSAMRTTTSAMRFTDGSCKSSPSAWRQPDCSCWICMATVLEQPEVVTAGLVPDPMLPMPYRIQRVKQQTYDTFTLEILPEDSGKRFSFAPGQFNMLYVFGVGEVPISISSDPDDAPLLKHTTRVVGTVTKAMRQLKRGDTIGIRGPFGTHWPVEEAAGRDVVIVAGGIGLAPLRPALYRLMAEREKFRKIVLLYGTRTPEDMLYRHELEHWRGKFDLEIQVTVDRAASSWRGNVGVVTTMIPRAPFDPSNTAAFICGPEVMMRFTAMELQKRGVATERMDLSLERNMKCGIGLCGHCQYGPVFTCKEGPVFSCDCIAALLGRAEV